MPIPNLEDLCVELTVTPVRLGVTFPGGAALDAQLPDLGLADPAALAKQLLAEANAALAPMVPVFNVIDTVLAVVQAVNAIPAAITHLNPGKISDALPDVARKASKLLAVVPQASVPLMIVGLIDTLLAFLGGLSGRLRALLDQQVRIQQAESRAAALGNASLHVVVACSRGHVDAQLAGLSASAAPVNRLIALINVFAQLAGLGPLPDLPDLGRDAQAALQPVADTVTALTRLRNTIPV
jgi:hypothetical protein